MGPTIVEVSPYEMVSTTGYDGQAPGPLLRMKEAVRTIVEFVNETDVPEVVHWHGLLVPAEVDGAPEESTPVVPAHGTRRYSFVAKPAGFRWYHTQVHAGDDLSRGLYGGQFGFIYIEPKSAPAHYDQELFLALREWQPFFTARRNPDGGAAAPAGDNAAGSGLAIGYRMFSVNDHGLGNGDPIRVRPGQRVLFHLLNASATEVRRVALPGHKFQVIALDGNAVPTPQTLDVLQLAPGERVDAVAEMNQPGIWIFGCLQDDDRKNGMGTIVQYEGQKGEAQWTAPPSTDWDYTAFGGSTAQPAPDGRFELAIAKIDGGPGKFDRWTINGKSFPQTDALRVRNGGRYRLAMKNGSGEPLAMHLHRHIFELVSVDGKATSGVMKDTVLVGPSGAVEVDFVADQPGPALLQCQQQMQADNGLMAMVQYGAAPAPAAKGAAAAPTKSAPAAAAPAPAKK